VGEHAGGERAELGTDAVLLAGYIERVAVVAVERDVEAGARATLVVERPAHERGHEAVLCRDVLVCFVSRIPGNS
jgi:hypothetical protein